MKTISFRETLWGKQVAVRFKPNELEKLDALVAAAARAGHPEDENWNWRATRSSVLVRLVKAAAAKTSPAAKKGGRR